MLALSQLGALLPVALAPVHRAFIGTGAIRLWTIDLRSIPVLPAIGFWLSAVRGANYGITLLAGALVTMGTKLSLERAHMRGDALALLGRESDSQWGIL